MRWAVAALVLTACVDGATSGPEDVKFDRDTCAGCSMVISDRHFAAQVRGGPRNTAYKFDDVGCAVRWLEKQPWAAEPGTRVWVARLSDGAWLDAKGARYVGGKTSPMGFGFGAVDAATGGEAIDFNELQRTVLAMDQHRAH